jgi:GH25 family lysozyme M1 (1,4-beta-N-acetylmuramidase)
MAKIVLDVSNNRPITGADFRASGSVALIAKATEGGTFRDSTLSAHRTIARVARKPFGSYLFLHPDSSGSEAGLYLAYARPRKGDVQPIIDAEVTTIGTTELAKRTQRCARALEAKGYKPILYASSSIWKEMIQAVPSLKRLRVWEAQYPGRFSRWFPRLAKLRVRLGSGVTVVLWQFTDAYAVNGKSYDASVLLTDINNILI